MSHISSSMAEADNDTVSEFDAPSRPSTSSSASLKSCQSSSSGVGTESNAIGAPPRPATAPLNLGSNKDNNAPPIPPRAIRTAPSPTNSSNNNGDQNVRVVARVRPLSTKEINEKSNESIVAHSNISTIGVHTSEDDAASHHNGDKRKFEFDSVFGPDSTQKEVYDNTCGDMISTSIFRGFNATILAYGQTGSGKTFTMGTDGSSAVSDDAPPSESEGVIARAVYDLFQTRKSLSNGSKRVKVTMSYLEIYNEQAIDLLNDDPASSNQTLQVRDSKTEGVVIPNLKHFTVSGPGEVSRLMEEASLKRATASTHMNAVSSRSHAICTLNVTIAPDLEGGGGASSSGGGAGDEENEPPVISPRSATQGMRAKLTLVDLAGSERIKRTGAEGARMKEGININKGLFVLGQVVSALSELGQRGSSGGQNAHIPYRDSKLTRLLQDSLGGNSKTVMIACISPAESNIEESTNTLRYAERTRNIKNSAVRNVVSTGLSASEAAALRRENQQLKLELARMEAKMIVSNSGGGGSNGFSFARGGFISTGENESEAVTQLQAQCSTLLAEIDLLKGRAQNHGQEVLEASLRADKWQTKSEVIARLAVEQGVALPEDMGDDSCENGIVSELRNQLVEFKAELLEARTEAAVARATAGAVIAGNGDLTGIEETIMNSEEVMAMEASPSKEAQVQDNEELTTELSSVSATIEQKEAMVMQMNKERACMDNLQHHFENSLKVLQTEVDALTSERDELTVKLTTNNGKGGSVSDTQQRRTRKVNDPVTKRLRDQISKLESRIEDLKLKASEHKKSLKMKEEAQKKCERLQADIAADKRRRADLQRKLKEASVEMRAEKKAAQQKAARMMRDSQKLKIELTKMKSAAHKQAAVLKRKIDQASAKEKARAELARKRRSAERMRLASSSVDCADINEGRKVELASWIDRELDFSLIKFEIDDQRRQLDKVTKERRKLVKNNGDDIDVEELNQMDTTIRSLRMTVQDLETAAKKAFPAASEGNLTSNFRFLETDVFKGLSKLDAKHVLSYIFDASSVVKREMATMISDQELTKKTNIESALAKEKQVHEKELMQVKMEHAVAKLNLLEATQGTLNSNIKIKMDTDDTDEEMQTQVDVLLTTYNESWTSATEELKSDLETIREAQEGLQAMMDKMAKGMTFSKKPTSKKKEVMDYESDDESEESFVGFGDEEDEDSEYEPTPTRCKRKKNKRKRRSPRLAKKVTIPNSPSSPIGENFIEDIDNKRVGSLKKACKKLGVPMTGKKADLKQRVRETILNSSTAILNSSMAGGNDESFVIVSSPLKKVNFEGGVAVDPEFQPIDENPASTESIKKRLWHQETDDVSHAPEPKSASLSAAPSKLTSETLSQSMTPFKRKKSPGSQKENKNAFTPKRQKPVGFMTSSPRPLSSHNAQRTPVHMKQTICTAKKRLVPDSKQSGAVTKRNITASTKKRNKRGMANAVAQALQQNSGLF